MMFGKQEKKKKHPMLTLTVGALAAVGACSIVRGSKRMIKETGQKMVGFFKKEEEECETEE